MDLVSGLDTGECTPEDLEKLKSLVPKCLEDYIVRKYQCLGLPAKYNEGS